MIGGIVPLRKPNQVTTNSHLIEDRGVKTMRLRDAKASLSAVVEAAERDDATTITKHGRPAAVVMSVEDARRLNPRQRPNFADLLLAIPLAIDSDRDRSPPSEAAL
jgi:prevent-host-death family protein